MMTEALILKTERLRLRPWREDDLEAIAAMNADPEVMRYFPACLERAETVSMMARNTAHMECHGFAWWALEIPDVASFAGGVSLIMPAFHAHFTPCFEIGWRLPRVFWGRGYATEAARALLDFAFHQLDLDEVVAMTTFGNERSRSVMQRLGMSRSVADDFGHPAVPFHHPLRHHVLYRLARQA